MACVMALYRDDAVVLRVQKLGESDRIITLLTRRHGRLRAVARGVRRTTSRFGARLEPFGHVDLQLRPEGRSRCTRSARSRPSTPYGKQFLADYPRYTAASAIAETAERLTPSSASRRCGCSSSPSARSRRWPAGEHAPAPGARRLPAAGHVHGRLGARARRVRRLRHPRAAPAFSVPAGGAVCPDCRPPGAAHPAPATLA